MLLTILTPYLGKLTAKYLPLQPSISTGTFIRLLILKDLMTSAAFCEIKKSKSKIPESQETISVCFARFSANALMHSSLNADNFSGFVKTSANLSLTSLEGKDLASINSV